MKGIQDEVDDALTKYDVKTYKKWGVETAYKLNEGFPEQRDSARAYLINNSDEEDNGSNQLIGQTPGGIKKTGSRQPFELADSELMSPEKSTQFQGRETT